MPKLPIVSGVEAIRVFYTVAFSRLHIPFDGKDAPGKRHYNLSVIDPADFLKIQEAVLHGIGLPRWTSTFDCIWFLPYPLCSRIGLKSSS